MSPERGPAVPFDIPTTHVDALYEMSYLADGEFEDLLGLISDDAPVIDRTAIGRAINSAESLEESISLALMDSLTALFACAM